MLPPFFLRCGAHTSLKILLPFPGDCANREVLAACGSAPMQPFAWRLLPSLLKAAVRKTLPAKENGLPCSTASRVQRRED
ncbi:hypothetical protein GUJ93_ZPchr0011g28721 [Zizania palustris]|uniref:Uncharacterized protein n=1 Tax=Zizania palustris TaxID=103762 RepID=A0A8J5WGP1_ZIZPA|nr:hypothetical protein GUJ93_ZPchr0011g28721 [Zizania palustris]